MPVSSLHSSHLPDEGAGVHGLRVDLTSGRAAHEWLSPRVRGQYLGGRGLGAYLLLREEGFSINPLSPANQLVFVPGLLDGHGLPAAGRFCVCSRSPLTGTVFDGGCGSRLGAALRALGFDFLVLEGMCEEASVLSIGPDASGSNAPLTATHREPDLIDTQRTDSTVVSVYRGTELWGLTVPKATQRLREQFGQCDIAVIGPAGERGVLFASIADGGGRLLGRGGLGAVMGAKRLKALVVRGKPSQSQSVRRTDEFSSLAGILADRYRTHPGTSLVLPRFGTPVLLSMLNEAGVLPTCNFQGSMMEEAEAIGAVAIHERFGGKRVHCPGCFIGCGRLVHAGRRSHRGPEYDSLWALGVDCGHADLEAVIAAHAMCDAAGMDAISMGSTIACTMEMRELGVLDGPRFGDGRAVLDLTRATAERRGLGDQLALGSRRFTRLHAVPELSMTVKSLELPGLDPRGLKGQGLAFATSNRGACHQRASMVGPELVGQPFYLDRFQTLGKAKHLAALQDFGAVLDSLGLCSFAAQAVDEDLVAALLSACLDVDVAPCELSTIGERIWNAEKLFNLAAGFTRADDSLPPRLLLEPIREGPSKGHTVDLAPMLDEYYEHRGWDSQGQPREGRLHELNLGPADI